MDTHDQDQRATLQHIVDRLTVEHRGDTPQNVRRLLERDMTAAGIELGAHKWLGDSAVEIAAGRTLIVDPRAEHRLDDELGVPD